MITDWCATGMAFRRTGATAYLPPLDTAIILQWLVGVRQADEADTEILLLTDCCATDEFQYSLARESLADFLARHLRTQPVLAEQVLQLLKIA
ncbi:hypothetical protein [Beggiatoa leptomitoformis]|uniref:Uncharacterized protein n=1 Tax=Beggiatoa leptomitoformis TaxID=288004 RepID=A0A2N9YA45_9GAMM|nr:hypothetical protein [Beggiatoa leptomitoformis]ALG67245.1 hypothetical protein AL038_05420 [Beggiatoa leptomitoformis]AUI67333.1 hypothetical protein BLE401_00560 [Beggiatoa leptomitoformis]